MTANSWSQRLFGCFRAQPSADLLPCIAKHHHDLRSDQNAESRTHNQYDTDSDVMQIAWAFVPIAPSGPSAHDPCRCHHIQKNGSGIDDQTNPEGHATETKAVRPRQIYYIAPKAMMSGEPYVGVGREQRRAPGDNSLRSRPRTEGSASLK